MTPKEKAVELFNKMFYSSRSIEVEQAKKCALIAVEELIKETGSKYWYSVKQELEQWQIM